MCISESNLDFEEEVKLMRKIIVNEKKIKVLEKTEKNKDTEKEKRKVTEEKELDGKYDEWEEGQTFSLPIEFRINVNIVL